MHHILCAKPALSDLWVGHISLVRNVVLTTKYGDAEAAKVAEEQVVQKGKGLANSIGYPERRFSCAAPTETIISPSPSRVKRGR